MSFKDLLKVYTFQITWNPTGRRKEKPCVEFSSSFVFPYIYKISNQDIDTNTPYDLPSYQIYWLKKNHLCV